MVTFDVQPFAIAAPIAGVRVRLHDEQPAADVEVIAVDHDSGERTMWSAGDDAQVGESVFAPDPNGTAEDDGWLVNAVYFSDTDHTDVCVLDARDVAAGPVARVRMPRRIPFGFHANWFPSD